MATTLDALKAKFLEDVGWFNADEFSKYSGLQYDRFDDDITMKKINDPDYHKGKGAVSYYFDHTGTADKAQFHPDNNPSGPNQQPVFQEVSGLGFVSGTADFVYSIVETDTRRIAYSFTYKKSASGVWKAIHLWGIYIDGK